MAASDITVTFRCGFKAKRAGEPCDGVVNTTGDRSGFRANCGKCSHPFRVSVKG